jgi:large subunit ribosomal protein L25
MDLQTLEAQPRATGSKAARAIRDAKNVPCILYGRNQATVPFQVTARAVQQLIFQRTASLVSIELNGESWDCILKDYDLHPITDLPIHADFQVMQAGQKLTVTVPIRYKGTPIGQKEGGDTQYIVREMAITTLPSRIPQEIEVDVTGVRVGDAIHVYDLEMDDDFVYDLPPEQTLVTVVAPQGLPVEEEEEAVAEEGEAVEPAAGEGETPAEGEADTEGDL